MRTTCVFLFVLYTAPAAITVGILGVLYVTMSVYANDCRMSLRDSPRRCFNLQDNLLIVHR